MDGRNAERIYLARNCMRIEFMLAMLNVFELHEITSNSIVLMVEIFKVQPWKKKDGLTFVNVMFIAYRAYRMLGLCV